MPTPTPSRIAAAIALSGALALPIAASAQAYRCKQPDGSTTFQQSPCAGSIKTAVAPPATQAAARQAEPYFDPYKPENVKQRAEVMPAPRAQSAYRVPDNGQAQAQIDAENERTRIENARTRAENARTRSENETTRSENDRIRAARNANQANQDARKEYLCSEARREQKIVADNRRLLNDRQRKSADATAARLDVECR